jgi:hypothetical protein
MTAAQLEKITDDLAEQHGLSPQLTRSWLRENGYTAKSVKASQVNLIPQQVESLCAFARL